MPIKLAINGFGRIGRTVTKRIIDGHDEIDLVAINDLSEPETMAHLLKYDSVYGRYQKEIEAGRNSLTIDGKEIKVFSEKEPANLPWKELKIDIVLECTGKFTDYEGAKKHIDAGAKKIILSAPSKDAEKIPTYILGVNEEKLDLKKYDIMDMGSCTTNCLAPVAKVLNDTFGIEKGFMSTIHAYTNDQRILDVEHKDLRRARAAALNIIPTTTGAAKAIGRAIPELKGKLDGIAFRVPTPTVSVVDLVCLLKKETDKEEINAVLKKASQSEKMRNILAFEEQELVSSDFIGNCYSSIVDAPSTMCMGNLVKIVSWYDNEWGYSCRLAEFAGLTGKKI